MINVLSIPSTAHPHTHARTYPVEAKPKMYTQDMAIAEEGEGPF